MGHQKAAGQLRCGSPSRCRVYYKVFRKRARERISDLTFETDPTSKALTKPARELGVPLSGTP